MTNFFIHPNSSKDDSYIDTQSASYWDFFSVESIHKVEFSAGITGREKVIPYAVTHDVILVTIGTSIVASIFFSAKIPESDYVIPRAYTNT